MSKIFFGLIPASIAFLFIVGLPLNAFGVDACCLPDGSCKEEEAPSCSTDNGIFFSGTVCSQISCPPTLYLGENFIDSLYAVSTTAGSTGYIGSGNCEGLAPSSDPSFLFCVNDDDTLYRISTADGTRTTIGSMGASDSTGDKGLAYNTVTGILYGVDLTRFGSINTSTGAYTALASHPSEDMECLAANPNQNVIYGVDWGGSLYIYNVGTNTWASSSLDTGLDGFGCGLAFDPNANILYFIDGSGVLYSINPNTLVVTAIRDTGLGDYALGLAFVRHDRNLNASIPTLTQWGMIIFIVLAGLGSVYYMRRRKRV